MSTTIVGLYRTEADVERVGEDLARGGFDRQQITRHDETEPDLRAWLVDQGVPEREADDYVQGVVAGGKLITIEVSDDRSGEAVQVMQQDDRTAAAATTGATNRRPAEAATTDTEGDETLEVVEEELDVGTRVVEGGGVRVSTFVTEEPVEKQVRVRDETVDVDRRAVDRPLTDAEADSAFEERTIEMTERTEDVVTGKTARVVEEVVVSKDVDERTETVRDTLRKTEVKVEHTGDLLTEDRDDYVTHHRDTLGRDEDAYGEYEAAYLYGVDLANHPEFRGRPWREIAPTAREDWVRLNGETWMESEPAVKYGYERASSRGER